MLTKVGVIRRTSEKKGNGGDKILGGAAEIMEMRPLEARPDGVP